MSDNILGNNIRKIREAYGLTREKFGNYFNLSKERIKKIEYDGNPTLDFLEKLFVLTGIPIDDLKSIELELNKRELVLDRKVFTRDLINLDDKSRVDKIFPFEFTDDMLNDYDIRKVIRRLENKDNKPIKKIDEIIQNAKTLSSHYYESKNKSYIINLLLYLLFEWINLMDSKLSHEQLQDFYHYKTNSIFDALFKFNEYSSNNSSLEFEKLKKEFIDYFDDTVIDFLKILNKGKTKDFVDYYISLRYMLGFNNLNLSFSNSIKIGLDMMYIFEMLGNKYAKCLFNHNVGSTNYR